MKKKAIPIFFAAVLAAILVTAYCMRIETIVYTGNTQYEENTLTRMIFGKLPNRLTYYLFHHSHAAIPGIDSYTVRFSGTEADVVIREKTEVGYIRYMGANFYFDRYGNVVESTDEVYEDIPEITGLDFDSIIVGQKIDTTQEMMLNSVLSFTQNFAEYRLPVSHADFTETGDIVLTMNDVTVQFGSTDHLLDKLYQLNALYPKLQNLSGTLYLSGYDGTQEKIVFRDNNRTAETQTASQDKSQTAEEQLASTEQKASTDRTALTEQTMETAAATEPVTEPAETEPVTEETRPAETETTDSKTETKETISETAAETAAEKLP